MIDPEHQQIAQSQRRRRPPALLACAVSVLALALSFAAVSFASSTVTVSSVANSKLGEQVVVNAQGRTVYALSPETAKHLLCRTSECLAFWPPLTVPSAKTKLKAGPGVQGHLGILRRHGGQLQVTLRGMPLYRFSRDHGKDESNGEGVKSFGGKWHAVTATSGSSPSSPGTAETPMTPAPAPTPPSPSPEPPYVY